MSTPWSLVSAQVAKDFDFWPEAYHHLTCYGFQTPIWCLSNMSGVSSSFKTSGSHDIWRITVETISTYNTIYDFIFPWLCDILNVSCIFSNFAGGSRAVIVW
jgi:hypothetical protein